MMILKWSTRIFTNLKCMVTLVITGGMVLGLWGCSGDDDDGKMGSGVTATSGDVADLDAANPDEDACDNVLKVVFRDFQESHPDFERPNSGWGPCQGVLEDTLDDYRKPVFRDIWGMYKVFDPECNDQCPNGGSLDRESTQKWGTQDNDYEGRWANWLAGNPNPSDTTLANLWDPYVPMFDGASSFDEWYHDSAKSKRVELAMTLEEQDDGAYVFDSASFFPMDGKGFNDKDLNNHNYLFTTELHLEFLYKGGEEFTFRGDDDLWIFVNNKIALDLGGMHYPFEGTIRFDELGLTKNQSYPMDVFHAERHTKESNFRIETNIECFKSVIIEVE